MLPIALVPVIFILWGVSEHLWTNRQLVLNEELRQQFEEEHSQNRKELEISSQILFHCVIRRTRGFTHCLSNIQVGDVVEILQEGVGPDQEYNLCRLPAPPNEHVRDTVGWFPIRWLQKLDDYERRVQQQQEQSRSKSEPA